MAVFAHPDDESFGPSSTLVKYSTQGVKTYLICATRGEAGEVSGTEAQLSTEELGKKREEELKCAVEALGLTDYRILGYPDGGLQAVDFQEFTGKIVAAIREFKPDVLITFGPEGITGHTDHIVVSRATEEAYYAASDPRRFTGEIYGKLAAHSPAKLYYYVLPKSMVKELGLSFEGTEDSLVTTEIDVSGFEELRSKAIRCHRTQLANDAKEGRKSDPQREKYRRVNYFWLAASRSVRLSGPEKDLFAGLI